VTPRQPGGLAGEWRAGIELGRLVADPVYYGIGVPRGDGRPVVVVPGLFGNDLYLEPLRAWLRRIGYRPLRSGLLINAGCPERLSRAVDADIGRQLGSTSTALAVIGHSRGGILGWAVAARRQQHVSHLVLLGSPIGAALGAVSAGAAFQTVPAARGIASANAFARQLLDPDCEFPGCACAFVLDLRRPLSERTQVTSIRTRDDAIVAPGACLLDSGRNVEVAGTHSGLACNVEAYRAIAVALARRD
jgi:pimeloyl-ACP methyl ester carboxylesterase